MISLISYPTQIITLLIKGLDGELVAVKADEIQSAV